MKVYLVNPFITLKENPHAENFFRFIQTELEKHIETTIIVNEFVLQTIQTPTNQDIIIFFNQSDDNYSSFFQSFLREVVDSGTKLLPISITSNTVYHLVAYQIHKVMMCTMLFNGES